MHPAQVPDIACKTHARMVVYGAGGIQPAHRHVDGPHAGARPSNVGWQLPSVSVVGQRPGMQRLQNRVALMCPYMAEESAPTEFKDELVPHVQAVV